ncbi:hypothetical protein DAI22_11g052400 [Oryza sativa Japonica Group]|nr:hypothetical protein DAI22_11g052400 [Oryza sativa Japonica Group]KAF2909786.1 hypothetical protein DAI22_11g052400 [Oryza sativa Japonica Group]KAF2909787.1 hypothetical protein DAI22_11g052400 [Oryza sativa Japonica Group]
MLLLPAHISHFLYTCFVRLYPEFLGSGNGRPRERHRRPPAAGSGRTAKSASDGWKGVAAAAAGGRSRGEVGGQQRATPRGSCLERRAATSSCSPSPSCRLVTAPHGGRGERGLWRLMSKREGCLPSGSEGPSSPQPMTPCRPPHLIEASSSSAKAACTRQRSSDVLRSGHGVLHFAVTYMCS